jgi:hypothetical protein
MLTQEPSHEPAAPTRSTPRSPAVKWMLLAAFLFVLALRHDFWNWDTPGYLLFGFVPVGLWWQAMVSICASLFMWLMVTFAWPGQLEVDAIEAEKRRLESRASSDNA